MNDFVRKEEFKYATTPFFGQNKKIYGIIVGV